MSDQVRVAGRHDGAERCPMCHDVLAELSAGEPVPCPRCGTAHHRTCAEELLRCSVLGCGGPLADGAPGAPRTPTEELAERVRARVRERAQRFRGAASDADPDRERFDPVLLALVAAGLVIVALTAAFITLAMALA